MNKRQRKKIARRKAQKYGVYRPRNTFRSTMSIQSTLFDPNDRENEKLVFLAERNLNRIAYVITKPDLVNLTKLTLDDVKYLQSAKFSNVVNELQQYFAYDRSYYKDPEAVDNATREVMTDYFYNHHIESTRALHKALIRLNKQLAGIVKKYGGDGGYVNPFIIVKYLLIELR